MTSAPVAVEIQDLKKSYGFKPILRGIDLQVRAGERVALLGANGAGKTTLLRILACLAKPSAGSVHLYGWNCARDVQEVRRLIGFVGHQSYLYEELTARENLEFFARMYSVPEGRERALTWLNRVGLEKYARERVGTFSRGQLQRLSWARALLHQPDLLLLDEPDTGLDQQGLVLIDKLLDEHIERSGSAIFITHQLERAQALSDRIVLLARGRIARRCESEETSLETLRQVYQEVVG
ncbi:heme ABC exporter ATP-binding protein CcmA [Ktedonospora formicarum]|uniref:ABC transporter ATP-binding protein n=1 Tax=Ktedonospora formicarum TaxID=2778364 RepID=A0A8J3HUW3_9CHLR|nr:heme ABC exporter ATP-binding protein CcmA [Ktedonospora formicarum]GHO43701.1 ABC transporter ATP-binding protein [Ktedonospora formicarum]